MFARLPVGCLLCVCGFAAGTTHLTADDKKPEKKVDGPLAVLYFNTNGADTKDTVLPKGTRIQIRVEAGDYEYDYNTPTVEGETVADIAQQVYENMKTAGWLVESLTDGRGFIVTGRIPMQPNVPPVYKAVEKVGIHYSTEAQPVEPGAQGGVKVLGFEKGMWKLKPDKK